MIFISENSPYIDRTLDDIYLERKRKSKNKTMINDIML